MTEAAEQKKTRKPRRRLVGIVTSAHKTPKTLRVEIAYKVQHSQYRKLVPRLTVVHAHDEKGEAKLGDRVEVMECRPISKMKNWRLLRVVEAAPE